MDRSFSAANDATPDGLERPRSALRSGGPGSLSPWERLGFEGRRFVAGGPSTAALAAFHGPAVREPIRVYAGLDSDQDLRDLAALAVAELDRTGAFDRAVLCVVVPTGRGWVNPVAAAALEHLWAGDTAIVSLQYSYLPSALEFLIDAERARAAGRALFDAVHARWSAAPPRTRPLLLLQGESLGSTGAQAPFADLADLRARTDGALFVGPPQSNRLWREHLAGGDPGSTMVLPTVDRGRAARSGSTVADIHGPDLLPWERPRVLFLHHPSDPVAWWSPQLLLRRRPGSPSPPVMT